MTPDAFDTALRARGIELILRRQRLHVWPGRAYRLGLSDAERDYIASHRKELKALVLAGRPQTTVQWQPPGEAKPERDAANRCPYCCRHPCIGRDHHAFAALHALDPHEQQRQHTERQDHDQQERDMRRRFRMPSPTWE